MQRGSINLPPSILRLKQQIDLLQQQRSEYRRHLQRIISLLSPTEQVALHPLLPIYCDWVRSFVQYLHSTSIQTTRIFLPQVQAFLSSYYNLYIGGASIS